MKIRKEFDEKLFVRKCMEYTGESTDALMKVLDYTYSTNYNKLSFVDKFKKACNTNYTELCDKIDDELVLSLAKIVLDYFYSISAAATECLIHEGVLNIKMEDATGNLIYKKDNDGFSYPVHWDENNFEKEFGGLINRNEYNEILDKVYNFGTDDISTYNKHLCSNMLYGIKGFEKYNEDKYGKIYNLFNVVYNTLNKLSGRLFVVSSRDKKYVDENINSLLSVIYYYPRILYMFGGNSYERCIYMLSIINKKKIRFLDLQFDSIFNIDSKGFTSYVVMQKYKDLIENILSYVKEGNIKMYTVSRHILSSNEYYNSDFINKILKTMVNSYDDDIADFSIDKLTLSSKYIDLIISNMKELDGANLTPEEKVEVFKYIVLLNYYNICEMAASRLFEVKSSTEIINIMEKVSNKIGVDDPTFNNFLDVLRTASSWVDNDENASERKGKKFIN